MAHSAAIQSDGERGESQLRSAPPAQHPWTRNFRLLWTGSLFSEVGGVASAMAALVWMQQTTGSSLTLGWVLAGASLPGVLLTPLGGALADRLDRRSILVVCDVLSGAAMLVLAAVFLRGGESSALLTAVAATLIAVGVLHGLFRPTVAACIPDTVPESQLDAANGWYGSASSLARITGHAAAGTAYTLIGPAAMFALDGLSFLVSGFLSSRLRLPSQVRPAATLTSWAQDLAEVFGYLRSNRGLRQLITGGALLHFLLSPVTVLLPFFTDRALGVGPAWLGYMFSSFAAGTALGFVAADPVVKHLCSRRSAFALALVLEALLLTALGITRSAGLAVFVVLGLGATFGLAAVVVQTTLQLTVPGQLRGRVFGVLLTFNAALIPASFLIAGALGEVSGDNVGAIFFACGLGMCAVVAWLLTRSRVRALMTDPKA